MRITQEADGAVRIVDCLARSGGRRGAQAIAESTGVTLRFTLKILHKLVQNGIVVSYKGVQGGFELARAPEAVNMRQVIEAVDGPIAITRCLSEEQGCCLSDTGNGYGCYYNHIFAEISRSIQQKFESIDFAAKPEKGSARPLAAAEALRAPQTRRKAKRPA